jgi:hypothetical protein
MARLFSHEQTILRAPHRDLRKSVLLASGLRPGEVTSQSLGNSRPIVSNATEAGRMENRRVEIVISGDPIGTLPFWDRAYRVTPRQ